MRQARGGVIQSALRVAEFESAREEAEKLIRESPRAPESLALYGDALWASGLFEQAEAKYQEALAGTPELARGLHGMARSLAARSQLEPAMVQAQAALRLAPRDLEIHHTVGAIYERSHKFEEAAAAYTNYVNLLPNKDTSYKASWSRNEIRFLRSFGATRAVRGGARHGREAVHDPVQAGERQGGRPGQSERRARTGLRRGHGVGEHGHHAADRAAPRRPADHADAQRGRRRRRASRPAARADRLAGDRRVQDAQRPVPHQESAARAPRPADARNREPVAAGARLLDDDRLQDQADHAGQAAFPLEPADFELPLRLHRLATVQGTIDGSRHANFIIDTGGEVISISQASANALGRKEGPPDQPARVRQLRLGSERVPDARRQPGVRRDSVPELLGRRPESRHARARSSASRSAASSATGS